MVRPPALAWIVTSLLATFPSATRSKFVVPNPPFDGGTQFIYFPGNISGTFAHNATRYSATRPLFYNNTTVNACGDNGTYYFIDSGHMRVGVSAPWDSNPLYFDLVRDEDHLHFAPFWSVFFASANYACRVPNGTSGVDNDCKAVQGEPYYYAAAEQLNLTAASITVAKGQDYPWAAPFYSVKGDDATWIGDGTVNWNQLDFEEPLNYTYIQDSEIDCLEYLHVTWNNDTKFTYALNFTNATVSASFVITVPEGILTVSFSGKRRDTPSRWRNPGAPPDPGDIRMPYEAIILQDPASNALPNFTFVNGSKIHWTKDENQLWHATSSAAAFYRARGGRVVGIVSGAYCPELFALRALQSVAPLI